MIHPGEKRGQAHLQLHGELAAILAISMGQKGKGSPKDVVDQVSVVAGACNIGVLLSQARDIVQSHEYHVKR